MARARRNVTTGGRLLVLGLLGATGCDTLSQPLERINPTAPPAPADTAVIRAGALEQVALPDDKYSGDLAGGHELFRQEQYGKAAGVFHRVAEKSKNVQISEEARFYEAESYRLQGRYPKAIDCYHKMLIDFASGVHRQEAAQRMYEIANYWLDDTRAAIQRAADPKAGPSWPTIPAVFHFEKSKPLLDEEGRALQALEYVHVADVRGPLGEKALFLAGKVKLFREDYRAADDYFSQLIQQYPNSELAPDAIECAIFAKHMSTGGPDYDARKSSEAYQMIRMAQNNYAQLVAEKGELLDRQMVGIHIQHAEKDFRTAEFYRRTGKLGSAYFYYELVRRRYPGTPQAEKATEAMFQVREQWEKRPDPDQHGFVAMMQRGWDKFLGRPDKAAAGPGAAAPKADGDKPVAAPEPKKPADDAQPLPTPRKLPDSLPGGAELPR
jgi:tetratricopeptide (TPR) repeat protein